MGGGGVELVPLSVALVNSQLAAAFALPGFGDLAPALDGAPQPWARSLYSTDTHALAAGSLQGVGDAAPGRSRGVVLSPGGGGDEGDAAAPLGPARRRLHQAKRRAQQQHRDQADGDAAAGGPLGAGTSAAGDELLAAPTEQLGSQQPAPSSIQQQQLRQWSQGALELSSDGWGGLHGHHSSANNPAGTAGGLRTPSTTGCTTTALLGRTSAPQIPSSANQQQQQQQGTGLFGPGLAQQQASGPSAAQQMPILLPPAGPLSEPGISSQGAAPQQPQLSTAAGLPSVQQQPPQPASSLQSGGALGQLGSSAAQQQQQQQQQLLAIMAYHQQVQQALAQQQHQQQQQQQQLQAAAVAAAAAASQQQQQSSAGGGSMAPFGAYQGQPGQMLLGAPRCRVVGGTGRLLCTHAGETSHAVHAVGSPAMRARCPC